MARSKGLGGGRKYTSSSGRGGLDFQGMFLRDCLCFSDETDDAGPVVPAGVPEDDLHDPRYSSHNS